MIELKSAGEIAAMRAAGRVVAAVHAATRAEAGIGVTLKHLDDVARTVIEEAKAGGRRSSATTRPSAPPPTRASSAPPSTG
ncbi:hypothetical protein [Nonomuraea salmonea]|uniref:hypothetical protein n=1 Tax=Nonomuraea salmonea TaxID=46181 RepID=UPI002FE75A3C